MLIDIIQEILEAANLFRSNMHIVSNAMQFNHEKICIGFKEPLIHVFNKNEAVISSTPYANMMGSRKNVVSQMIPNQHS